MSPNHALRGCLLHDELAVYWTTTQADARTRSPLSALQLYSIAPGSIAIAVKHLATQLACRDLPLQVHFPITRIRQVLKHEFRSIWVGNQYN